MSALAVPQVASAATVSLWHMDERSGSTMFDSVGTNNGTLSHVALGQPGYAGTAYGFNGRNSIVTVPSTRSLNPGSASFTVTAAVKTSTVPTDDSADILRKGLSTDSNTYFKMEVRPTSTRSAAKVRCYFAGSSTSASVYATRNVNDGAWHVIQCVKQAGSISIVFDGRASAKSVAVGSISNTAALRIGAKSSNDDRYTGVIDEVRFQK